MIDSNMSSITENISKFLSDLRRKRDISTYSETDTKQSIQRILQLLLWDPFDTDEVMMEYTVGSNRVDFALRIHNRPKVFIEAKKFSEDLPQHEEQLVLYATRESVRMAALTNGITWWFYLPLVEGDWKEKKFILSTLENRNHYKQQ